MIRSAIIYPLLCGAVLLPSFPSAAASPAQIIADRVPASVQMAQEQTIQAQSAADQTNETNAKEAPDLILSKCFLLKSENYDTVADGFYQTALLTVESSQKYPVLSSALTALSKEMAADCREEFDEVAQRSSEYLEDNRPQDEIPPSATYERKILPVRQDDKVLSFFTSSYSMVPGEIRGTTTYKGITLDAATGEEVTLDRVLRDVNNKAPLVKAINENLRVKHTGLPAGDREESVSVALASVDYQPTWVVSDRGVTFLFNAGAVGMVEEGALEAEVSFAKYPHLFTTAYAAHTGSYTLPVNIHAPAMADLMGDGTVQRVGLNARPSDEEQGAYTALVVSVDDKQLLYETYFFGASAVFFHTKDNRNYMYVQTITENDSRNIYVFDLNGEQPVFKGELTDTSFCVRFRIDSEDADLWYLDEEFISSPESFSLDTRISLMSTYLASKRYRISDDGMPVALSDYYMIDSDLTLVSLTDLPADTVDPVSGAMISKGAVLPKGTKCTLYRTNGRDTVDLKAADGNFYRFTVVNEWPQKVNGLRLDQAFDGTFFTH